MSSRWLLSDCEAEFLFRWTIPVAGYDVSFDFVTKFSDDLYNRLRAQEKVATDPKTRSSNKASAELVQKWSAKISSYRNPKFRVLHSSLCLLLAILLSGAEAFVGLALSRRLLRDLAQLDTLSSAFAVIASEIVLYAILSGTAMLLLTALAIPVVAVGATWSILVCAGITRSLAPDSFVLSTRIICSPLDQGGCKR